MERIIQNLRNLLEKRRRKVARKIAIWAASNWAQTANKRLKATENPEKVRKLDWPKRYDPVRRSPAKRKFGYLKNYKKTLFLELDLNKSLLIMTLRFLDPINLNHKYIQGWGQGEFEKFKLLAF